MNGFLRQATAGQTRILGPFIDQADGFTPENSLSITNTDIKLMVNGGAAADKNSGGGTFRANGDYAVTWDATDTATLGELRVNCLMAGARLVTQTYQVLAPAAYDAMTKGNGMFEAGTAQAVGATTLQIEAASDYEDNILAGVTAEITDGAFKGARGIVTSNVQGTDVLTIAGGWTGGVTPTGTPGYRLYASPAGASLTDIANAILTLTDGVETGVTPQGALRLILAAAAGILSGGGTATETIKNAVANDKNRMIATVDEDGNRSAITYDLT